jgi:hypothetical protein
MEGGATNFAVGLLLLWLSALCFFFALHPGGQGFKNPVDALKWMITEFQQTQGGASNGSSATTGTGS